MGIPIFTAKQIIKKLKRAGFNVDHQTGSHIIMRNKKGNMTIVPLHSKKDIKKGLMLSILKQANLSLNDFLKIKLTSHRRGGKALSSIPANYQKVVSKKEDQNL